MRIQHNIMAMNSYRNYNNNTKALSANLEKLSSGYKINRAGDDAAGLAISEKMRAQITGLDAAKKNAKDAKGLINTAEGALQEVQDMLNRMVYLAEQSANGTYDDEVDRKALQDEVNSLVSEINRIGQTANFNGKKLLNGEMAQMTFQIGDSAEPNDTLNMETALGDSKDFNLTAFIDDPDGTFGGGAAISVLSPTDALSAIETLRGAKGGAVEPEEALINVVSKFRGKLGAVSNRLDHTVNNLSVMQENIQDAESSIRDTDVADEMMKYTKNNILIQSAQAMLAQSNAVPQGVLQLLQ